METITPKTAGTVKRFRILVCQAHVGTKSGSKKPEEEILVILYTQKKDQRLDACDINKFVVSQIPGTTKQALEIASIERLDNPSQYKLIIKGSFRKDNNDWIFFCCFNDKLTNCELPSDKH